MVQQHPFPVSLPAYATGIPQTPIGPTLSVICSGLWLIAEWVDEQRTRLVGVREAKPQEVWLVAVAQQWALIKERRGLTADAFSVGDWIFFRVPDDRGLWTYQSERCGEPPVGEPLYPGVLPSAWIESLTGADALEVGPHEPVYRLPDGVADFTEAEIPF